MVLGLYGAGGLGTEFYNIALAINESCDKWEEIVYVDDTPEKIGGTLTDCRILSYKNAMDEFGKNAIEFIVAVGEPFLKDELSKRLIDDGCTITNLIHPNAIISPSCKTGIGVVAHSRSCLPPNSYIGNNVILQDFSVLGHDVIIGDDTVISSFAFVGGNTEIGKDAYIAPHACLRNGLHIGAGAIIGMGSVVTKDVPDNAVMVGNPAKLLRYNEKGRVFSK